MKRKSNRIQWKAVQAPGYEGRYDLYYRVYQSSLPKLVKLLYSGHHDWKCITESAYTSFKDKAEFIEFAKSHPTFGDIDGLSTVEHNAWIYPPVDDEK